MVCIVFVVCVWSLIIEVFYLIFVFILFSFIVIVIGIIGNWIWFVDIWVRGIEICLVIVRFGKIKWIDVCVVLRFGCIKWIWFVILIGIRFIVINDFVCFFSVIWWVSVFKII